MSNNIKDLIPKVEIALTAASFEQVGKDFIDAGILDTDAIVNICMRLKSHSTRRRRTQPGNAKKGAQKPRKDKSQTAKKQKGKGPKAEMTKEQKVGMAKLQTKVSAFTKLMEVIGPKISDDAQFRLGSETEAAIKSSKDFTYMVGGPYGTRLGLNHRYAIVLKKYSSKEEVLKQAEEIRQANPKIADPVKSAAIHAIIKDAGLNKQESDASRAFFPIAVEIPKAKWRPQDLQSPEEKKPFKMGDLPYGKPAPRKGAKELATEQSSGAGSLQAPAKVDMPARLDDDDADSLHSQKVRENTPKRLTQKNRKNSSTVNEEPSPGDGSESTAPSQAGTVEEEGS